MGEDGNGKTIVVALVFVSSLVAVVAIILAAVSLSKGSDGQAGITLNVNNDASMVSSGGGGGVSGAGGDGDKVWMIMIGHDIGAMEYLNEEGYIVGFHTELITEVCEAAGMQCRTVWDKYTNAMDSVKGGNPVGGVGLMDRYYDASASWVTTIPRVQIFDFSLPFTEETPTIHFHILKSDTTWDEDKAADYKIGFIDGWYTDESCIIRAGINLPVENTIHYKTPAEAVDGLIKNEVRAVFGQNLWYNHWYDDGTIKKATDKFYMCSLAGNAMMTRKDSNFNAHWNRGFQKLRDNGRFKKLCLEQDGKHGNRNMKKCIT